MEFSDSFQINYLFLALGLEEPFPILGGMVVAEKLIGSETELDSKLSSSREIKVPLYLVKVSFVKITYKLKFIEEDNMGGKMAEIYII